MTHTPDPQLFERPINILVVGCGGNGSAIAAGLPYLHQALLAFGHPGGLNVTSDRSRHRQRNQLCTPALLPNGNRTF